MKTSFSKRFISWLLLLTLALAPGAALAKDAPIVCLGADLTEAQRTQMLDIFKAGDDAKILTVTNEEEKAALGEYVSADKIGTRAISSVCIRPGGKGIRVTTHDTTFITADMVALALTTAGVENAEVLVAAPFQVSGTAALTGILKAYESAVDASLSAEAKQAATEELVRTGELGEVIGTEDAAQLMALAKQKVLELGLEDEEQIKSAVRESATQLNITLTDAQVNTLASLLHRISKLDLDPEKVAKQVNNLYKSVKKFVESDQGKGFIAWLGTAFSNLFNWIVQLFGK